jgi:hypothetical protein
MNENKVKKYLEQLKAEGKYDGEFIDELIDSDVNDDDGSATATKLYEIIDRRYVENKKN